MDIEKTICKSDLYYNSKRCKKDNFLVFIFPLINDFPFLNKDYIESGYYISLELYYTMTIIDNNYDYLKWKINKIIIFKIIRLSIFFLILSICLVFLYFIFINFFFGIKYYLVNQILYLIQDGSFLRLKNKNEIKEKKQEITIKPDNKEMVELKNLFNYLVKTMLFKLNFEQNEQIINENIDNDIDSLNDYIDLINNINNKEISIMNSYIISYRHFMKGLLKISETEFKELIKEVNILNNKIMNKNEINESNLKDTISRFSKISYLNEYSLTNELNNNTLHIVKMKLLSQKIYYLYGLNIYNQEKMKKENDKNYNKEVGKMKFEESIEYFIECKNISSLLGLDSIRKIFSLIMISKCYLELKNYKESMININEALLIFYDLQNAFKDKPYFNPKIMIFTENYIFQSIMLSMARTTSVFNKYSQSCWILMKMIETSPLVFNDIHYQSCNLLSNCLNKIEA